MSAISDMILNRSRKFLEDKDRRGEAVKDFRKNKTTDEYIRNAEKHGILSELKSGKSPGEDSVAYLDGVEAFANTKAFKDFNDSQGAIKTPYLWDPSKQASKAIGGRSGSKAPSITTVSDIRDNLSTERSSEIIRLGVRQTRIREFATQIPTTKGAFTAPRETGFVNNAAGRPENVDSSSVTSASQSRISIEWPSVKVITIDHYVDFPQELMEDIPAFIAFMRERGVDGVDDEEDNQWIAGAGEGSNEFLGLTTDPDIATYNWSDGDTGDNMADAILGAHVAILAAEYMPDRNLLSVLDHALICKLKDDNGQYLFPAAHRSGDVEFALWGVPTSRTTALTTGTGVSGAFRRAAEYRSRKQIGFRLTDSHGTQFTGGILTLVIERRARGWVRRPESFREINFDNAPA